MKHCRRKHWTKYPIDETGYGHHRYGIGVYLLNGKDYWLDWEVATPEEKEEYRRYLKKKGYKEKERK